MILRDLGISHERIQVQFLPRPSFHEALRRRDKGTAQEGPAAANRAAHLRAEATAAIR